MKLHILTPMYNGDCKAGYHNSVLGLVIAALTRGINGKSCQLRFNTLTNESLIPRARNKLTRKFLKGDAEWALWWDADLWVDTAGLLRMLAVAEERKLKLCGAIYSKKNVNWDRVAEAARWLPWPLRPFRWPWQKPDPRMLAAMAPNFVFNFPHQLAGTRVSFDANEPQSVLEVATGLSLVHRDVYESMMAAWPGIAYKPVDGDIGEPGPVDPNEFMWDFYSTGVCPLGTDYVPFIEPEYLSEDWSFSRRWKKLNGDVWMCPWIKTRHTGSYDFAGDVEQIARAGVSL